MNSRPNATPRLLALILGIATVTTSSLIERPGEHLRYPVDRWCEPQDLRVRLDLPPSASGIEVANKPLVLHGSSFRFDVVAEPISPLIADCWVFRDSRNSGFNLYGAHGQLTDAGSCYTDPGGIPISPSGPIGIRGITAQRGWFWAVPGPGPRCGPFDELLRVPDGTYEIEGTFSVSGEEAVSPRVRVRVCRTHC